MSDAPAEQQWFWTERWQAMEREADQDVAAGRVQTHESADEFLTHLEAREFELRFQTTAAFDRDFKASPRHQEKFCGRAFPLFHDCAT